MTWRHRLALLGGGIATLIIATPALAVGELFTEVAIRPIEPMTIGTEIGVVVDLRVAGGEPINDEPIDLSLDGEHVRRVRTGPDGSASFRLPRDLPPGEHALHATYPGRTDAYFSSEADFTLVVVPFELEIETVPPLPGMVFTLDGERFEAGPDGFARISISSPGDHVLTVLDEEYSVGGEEAEFSRWNTELFGNEITLRIPTDGRLQAGFDIHRPASQVFLDPDGGIVDPSRVTSITLRSSLGNVFTFADGEERYFKASRAVRRPNGLESVPVRYNVDAVEVDGSNVVNAGQQRFLVEGGGPWEITLLLYSAVIDPRDALFGFTAGEAVEVTYPNGHVERVEPDASGALHVQWLARGIYRMGVADAPGWAPAVPVALSRNQEVELRVVTYLDMVLAMAFAATVAIGLLHRGRPHLIPGLGRSAIRRLPLAGRARQGRRRGSSPTTTVHPSDDPPALTSTVPEGGLQHVALPILPVSTGEIAQVGTSAGDQPETGVATLVRADSELQTEVSWPSAQAPAESPKPTAKRARAARGGSASPRVATEATPPPTRTDRGSRPKRSTRAAKSAGSTAARTQSVVQASAPSSTPASAKRPRAARKPRAVPATDEVEAAPRAARTARTTKARPRRARGDAGAPATSPAAATAKPKSRRKPAPPAEPRRHRRRRVDSPSDPAITTAAAARAEQLALLGLSDADQAIEEPIDVTPVGTARTIAQQNCTSCGLVLWVGARYCRRCGSLQPGPESPGVHAAPVAAALPREGQIPNDDAHPTERDDTSGGLNPVGGSNRGAS